MDPRSFFRYPYMRFMVSCDPAHAVEVITTLAQKQGWHVPLRASLFNKTSRSMSSDFKLQGFRSILYVEPTRVGSHWEIRLRLDDAVRSVFTGDAKKAEQALRTLQTEAADVFASQNTLVGVDPRVRHKVSLSRPGFEIFQSWS